MGKVTKVKEWMLHLQYKVVVNGVKESRSERICLV